jgi:5,10-methylenetetrahydrofolate reductase
MVIKCSSKSCLVIAEMSCKISEAPSSIIQRAKQYLLTSEGKNSLTTWVAFSDTPLAHKKYYSLDMYLENKIFESLPLDRILPVMAIGSRNLKQINDLISQIRQLGLKKLLLVSGDEQQLIRDRINLLSTLDVLKNNGQIAKDFSIFTAAQNSLDQFSYLEQKIKYGASSVVAQPMYTPEKFRQFVQNFKTYESNYPLIMCVTPLASKKLLQSINKLSEMRLPRDVYEHMNALSDDELYREGIELAKRHVRMYFNEHKNLHGIYVYTWSVPVLESIVTEIALCVDECKI